MAAAAILTLPETLPHDRQVSSPGPVLAGYRSLLGNRQFVVADPDGYLLRFHEDLGWRARSARTAPAD